MLLLLSIYISKQSQQNSHDTHHVQLHGSGQVNQPESLSCLHNTKVLSELSSKSDLHLTCTGSRCDR